MPDENPIENSPRNSAKTPTGWCMYASPGSHFWCNEQGLPCSCECHQDFDAFDDGTRPGDKPAWWTEPEQEQEEVASP